jgi:hypothetical protein
MYASALLVPVILYHIGAVVPPQAVKSSGIKKAFKLSLDTTATSTTVNTAGSNIGNNTLNIKDTTTPSTQGIAGVDILNGDSTSVSNNSVAAAGISTTSNTTTATIGTIGIATGNGATEYNVQQFTRPPELELEKYLALNSMKTATGSTGTYVMDYKLHSSCIHTVCPIMLVCQAICAHLCSCVSSCRCCQCAVAHCSTKTTYIPLTPLLALLLTYTYTLLHSMLLFMCICYTYSCTYTSTTTIIKS